MKNRIVRGVAGTFIIISLLLATYVNINWLWFTAFVGANLLYIKSFFRSDFLKITSICN